MRDELGGAPRSPLDAAPRRPPVGPAEPTPWQAGPDEPGRPVLAVLGLCIALVPIVNPKGPGNAGPIDVFMALAVTVALLWALSRGARLRVPYFVPTAAFVTVGLLAAMLSVLPLRSGVAVVQEIFLFCWCAALATVCRTPHALGVVIRTWALSVTAWAAVLVFGVVAGVAAITNAEAGGTRARLFFDHPNMAGNFFMIGMFVVVASGCPRRRWLRYGCVAVLFLAMFYTASNAALLSLVGGAAVAVFLHLRSRTGMVKATAVGAALVVALGAGAVAAPPLLAAAEQSHNPLLRYTVGRSPEAADTRTQTFAQQLEVFGRGELLGIGPAATKHTLDSTFAGQAKEAHNDYLATLVERGPLGVLALVALMGAVGARVVGITRRRLPPGLAAAIPVPAALGGACAAFAITAVTHEVLHYRWFWTLLGLVAAVHLLARPVEATSRTAARSAR
ncbi:O-antigen ligase family protein [Geodermatophilus ruber]|uniref:O-antigen ligase n=1 Tax=Geodermatophilus ruber TaxID=504800 RepID=A0A1I4G6K4_9ACTN|nr:O-antigen ligase family protein [Geodermatophilus ruber]SFL25644.1 O-antigen ligase [Geodermatophilus ruber]